jgi:hypothetical protein
VAFYIVTRAFAPFLAAVLLPVAVSLPATAQAVGSAEIPSRVIKFVEFDDRNRIYRVDLDSGRVTYTDSGETTPQPQPGPQLDGLALRVNQWFTAKITAPDRAETAKRLAGCIEVTLAKAGGLGLKGQAVIDDLANAIDAAPGLRAKLAGFPLGEALQLTAGDDPERIVPALRDAKKGLEAVK